MPVLTSAAHPARHPLIDEVAALVVEMLPDVLSKRYDIEWKPDGSPVTAADRMLEQAICDLVLSKMPGALFIGEEGFTAQAVSEGRTVAVLDPIDGTENFCSGFKEWGVSFTLFDGGRHCGSLLMLPELGLQLATGDPVAQRNSRITGLSSSITRATADLLVPGSEIRISGCAVFNLYHVIQGSFARFINPNGARIWDLLPGLLLALENGCSVFVNEESYDGRLLDPNLRYRVDIRNRYDLHPRQGAVG